MNVYFHVQGVNHDLHLRSSTYEDDVANRNHPIGLTQSGIKAQPPAPDADARTTTLTRMLYIPF